MVQLVVGAAIVRHGRVLAARRTTPPGWELPGGKVEPGEAPDEALVREIREELGIEVGVTAWLAGEAPIGETHVLRAAYVEQLDDADPHPVEHADLRWLAADELDDVDWLGPDRPFLAQLRSHLAGPRRL